LKIGPVLSEIFGEIYQVLPYHIVSKFHISHILISAVTVPKSSNFAH